MKTETYTSKRKTNGEPIAGYYVFCRGHHYILESYNDNGYDERWETSEWIEVEAGSVINIQVKELLEKVQELEDEVEHLNTVLSIYL